jgi:acetylornithine deacetylase/succinyl-diaminopimelate desuccinylase-like protein
VVREVLAVEGSQPAVYAEWLGAGPDAPTVTVYGHHDVQPVDPLDQWTTPPFEPTVRDGCLHARGASDDKGQVHFQLSAVRHLLAADGGLPVNLNFLVEGEEEAGSPSIEAFLGEHAERLACDVIVVSDTGMVAEGVPSLVTAMRGLVYHQVDVRTAPADLHSGVFGGTVPNALEELVGLLGRRKDDRAKVSFRLVADQDPARLGPLFQRWVRDNLPAHVQVGVQSFGGVRPCLTPLDHPANRAAARAVARSFGKEPLFNREGGSGPKRAVAALRAWRG